MPAGTCNNLVRVIKADLYRYGGATGVKDFLKKYLWEPGFRYTFRMRIAGFCVSKCILEVLYYVARYQRHRLEIKYGISIPHTTHIGG